MSGADVASLVIGLAVLAWVLVRQLSVRRLSESYRLSIILAVIGAVQFVDFLKGHPGNPGGIVAAVAGSLVLAAVFGVARAITVRVWRQGGLLMRKGTWITAILWIVAVAAHYGYDDLVGRTSPARTAQASETPPSCSTWRSPSLCSGSCSSPG